MSILHRSHLPFYTRARHLYDSDIIVESSLHINIWKPSINWTLKINFHQQLISVQSWLHPSSNGKQNLKFITKEHFVQQQVNYWCRLNILSTCWKFYFRVITVVIISLTVPRAIWSKSYILIGYMSGLDGPFVLFSYFYRPQLHPVPKNAKKEYDQYL